MTRRLLRLCAVALVLGVVFSTAPPASADGCYFSTDCWDGCGALGDYNWWFVSHSVWIWHCCYDGNCYEIVRYSWECC